MRRRLCCQRLGCKTRPQENLASAVTANPSTLSSKHFQHNSHHDFCVRTTARNTQWRAHHRTQHAGARAPPHAACSTARAAHPNAPGLRPVRSTTPACTPPHATRSGARTTARSTQRSVRSPPKCTWAQACAVHDDVGGHGDALLHERAVHLRQRGGVVRHDVQISERC